MSKTKKGFKALLICYLLVTNLSLFGEPQISLEKIEHTISESEIVMSRNTHQQKPNRIMAATFVVLIEIPGIDENTWMDVFLSENRMGYSFSYRSFVAHDNWERRTFYTTDKGLVLEFSAVTAPPGASHINRLDSPAGRKLVIFMAKNN